MSDTPALPELRRSVLFVPANNRRALAKAQALSSDVVVIDLEDAVAADEKQQLREELGNLIAAHNFGHRQLWVRINAVDTPIGHDDLRAVARLPVDGVVLPKVENPEDVHRTGILLGDAKRLIIMIETPRGVLAAAETLSAHPQVAATLLGTQDLSAALRLPSPQPDRRSLQYTMQATLMAARAAGIQAIDSVNADFRKLDALGAECAEARLFGFDGKAAIHPSQLETINTAFSVTENEIARAKAVITCFEQAIANGDSVASLDGQMIEALHARAAQLVLARSAREKALSSDL